MTRGQIAQVVREEIENLIKEKNLMPIDDYVIEEAEYQGKKVELGKVKRGGTKKFYVYVRDPKTKNVKKVSFGDTTGLSIKTKDSKRRKLLEIATTVITQVPRPRHATGLVVCGLDPTLSKTCCK